MCLIPSCVSSMHFRWDDDVMKSAQSDHRVMNLKNQQVTSQQIGKCMENLDVY